MNLIIRKIYPYYLQIQINMLWISWYTKNYNKINQVCNTFKTWNREIPSFSDNFSNLNSKTFIKNYKYWINWNRKMDDREKIVFKLENPFLMINEEEWVHIDLSMKEFPIFYYYFHYLDLKWKPILIFKSLDHLKVYVSIQGSTSDTLMDYINSIIQTENLSSSIIRNNEETEGFPKVIFDGNSIRLERG